MIETEKCCSLTFLWTWLNSGFVAVFNTETEQKTNFNIPANI